MIQALIVDLDYVLVQPNRPEAAVVREAAEAMAEWYLKKKRIKLDQPALVEAFVSEWEMARQQAAETHVEVLALDTLKAALEKSDAPRTTTAHADAALKEFFEPLEANRPNYPDTVEVLRTLHSDYKIALYTNAADNSYVQRLVNRNALRPWLAPTFSSAQWGWRKPKPDGLMLIAERLQLDPEEIVVVGASAAVDIQAAHHANMRSIRLARAEAPVSDGPDPTTTAAALSDLAAIIPQL